MSACSSLCDNKGRQDSVQTKSVVVNSSLCKGLVSERAWLVGTVVSWCCDAGVSYVCVCTLVLYPVSDVIVPSDTSPVTFAQLRILYVAKLCNQ